MMCRGLYTRVRSRWRLLPTCFSRHASMEKHDDETSGYLLVCDAPAPDILFCQTPIFGTAATAHPLISLPLGRDISQSTSLSSTAACILEECVRAGIRSRATAQLSAQSYRCQTRKGADTAEVQEGAMTHRPCIVVGAVSLSCLMALISMVIGRPGCDSLPRVPAASAGEPSSEGDSWSSNPCAPPISLASALEETAWQLWVAATCPVNQ